MTEKRDFRKSLEDIARTKSSVTTVFSDFTKIAACAVANQTREDEYLKIIKPYSKEELTKFTESFAYLIEEMEQNPFSDLLGEYYQTISSKSTRDSRGEFYTPEHISEFMARMTLDPQKIIQIGKPITISEPTCGGGGMILQAAKLFSPYSMEGEKSYVDLLRVTAQDLSPTACNMTYFNTTMWGIPTEVILGNSLTMDVQDQWQNIHWHHVGEHNRRAHQEFTHSIQTLDESKPYIPPAPDYSLNSMKQMDLEF